jgi:hypothetical protein
MPLDLTLDCIAPIPTGHRVQIIRAQRWVTPLGSSPHWADVMVPLVVDLETSVIYCSDGLADNVVPSPLAFKPDSRMRVASTTEGRVTSCIVSSDRVGEITVLKTYLGVEPTPEGYRQ